MARVLFWRCWTYARLRLSGTNEIAFGALGPVSQAFKRGRVDRCSGRTGHRGESILSRCFRPSATRTVNKG